MLRIFSLCLLASLLLVGVSPVSAQAEETYSTVDTHQPPTPVRVLPERCTGPDYVMPVRAGACRVTRYKARPTVIVWGDSHAWQQTPALIAQARATRTNLIALEMGACPPTKLRRAERVGQCGRLGTLALRTIERKARHQRVTVVLGGAWGLYADLVARMNDGWVPEGADASLARAAAQWKVGTPRAFRALDQMRRVRTVGLAQMPMRPDDQAPADRPAEPDPTDPTDPAEPESGEPEPQVAPTPSGVARETAIPREAAVARWLTGGVDAVVDSTSYLCSSTWCSASVNGKPTWLDALHVNPAVAPAFAPAFRSVFKR